MVTGCSSCGGYCDCRYCGFCICIAIVDVTMLSEVKLLDHWNSDREVAESAWASTSGQESRSVEDVTRVITQSIVPMHHDTPKESVWFKFWILCPIFVERQLDKYRMTIQKQDFKVEYEEGSFGRLGITQNELSLRYRTMRNSYIDVPEDVRDISEKIGINLPESYSTIMAAEKSAYNAVIVILSERMKEGELSYSELKRVREFYRGILGTGFMTEMQLICNLNALEHIFNQRLALETQPETREVARMMLEAVKEVCPITINKMIEVNGW